MLLTPIVKSLDLPRITRTPTGLKAILDVDIFTLV
jgi:hypothetical protein